MKGGGNHSKKMGTWPKIKNNHKKGKRGVRR